MLSLSWFPEAQKGSTDQAQRSLALGQNPYGLLHALGPKAWASPQSLQAHREHAKAVWEGSNLN